MEAEQNAGIESADSDKLASLSPASKQANQALDLQNEENFAELKMIDKEINSLREEINKTYAEIAKYKQRIEIGPKIEAEFVDLSRGYEQASANYQSLLEKKLQADLAENLELTQKGEQFKVLDRAYLPWKPYKPDVRKLLIMGFMLALSSGLGLAFLREYTDSTFWSKKELETALEVPVLISIPVIQTERERRWKKAKSAVTVCILLLMSSTLAYALLLLWKKRPGYL
jgi:hypothetical protein